MKALPLLLIANAMLAACASIDAVDLLEEDAITDSEERLMLFGADPWSGLKGELRFGSARVFFEALRGAPIQGALPGEPECEVDARFLDADGRPFLVQQAGDSFIDPVWQRDLEQEQEAEEQGLVDHEARREARALAARLAAPLFDLALDDVEPERLTLSAMARRLAVDPIHVHPFAPTLYGDDLGGPDNGPNLVSKGDDTYCPTKAPTNAMPKYVHRAGIYKRPAQVPGARIIGAEHSASKLQKICQWCGVTLLEVNHCNHGACADNTRQDGGRAMELKCAGSWNNRGATLKGQRNCTTEYHIAQLISGHVCNDDTKLQYDEVRTNTTLNAGLSTFDAAGRVQLSICDDGVFAKTAPECDPAGLAHIFGKDTFDASGKINPTNPAKTYDNATWKGTWEIVETYDVSSAKSFVLLYQRKSDYLHLYSVNATGTAVSFVTQIPAPAGTHPHWNLIRHFHVADANGADKVFLFFHDRVSGTVRIQPVKADGTLGVVTYEGKKASAASPLKSLTQIGQVDFYKTQSGTYGVFYYGGVKNGTGVGEIAIVRMGADGKLGTATTPKRPWRGGAAARIKVLSPKNMAKAGSPLEQFLLISTQGFVELYRLTDSGTLGALKDAPLAVCATANCKAAHDTVAAEWMGTSRRWSDLETYETTEGMFVVLVDPGIKTCTNAADSRTCTFISRVNTHRLHVTGKLGYQLDTLPLGANAAYDFNPLYEAEPHAANAKAINVDSRSQFLRPLRINATNYMLVYTPNGKATGGRCQLFKIASR